MPTRYSAGPGTRGNSAPIQFAFSGAVAAQTSSSRVDPPSCLIVMLNLLGRLPGLSSMLLMAMTVPSPFSLAVSIPSLSKYLNVPVFASRVATRDFQFFRFSPFLVSLPAIPMLPLVLTALEACSAAT